MFDAIKTVVVENWNNRNRLIRLANYEFKSQNSGTAFGFLWNFLNPALQIFVFWFVFAIGLKSAAPQGNYPYIIWMIVGIIPWFYISSAMTSSATSIYAYGGVLKRMYFPLAIVPVKTVLSTFIGHLWAMIVVFVVIFSSGYTVSSRWYQLPYFMIASLAFLIGFSLFSSAITVVFKDFQKILASIVRLLFYITPIVWVQDKLPEKFQFALRFNPLAYIIEGYRDSLLYDRGIMYHGRQAIYFWCVTILMFVFGCVVHMKFRKQFIDLI